MQVNPNSPKNIPLFDEIDEEGNLVGLIASDEDDEEYRPTTRLKRRSAALVSSVEEKRRKAYEEIEQEVELLDRISHELCPDVTNCVGNRVIGRVKEAHALIEMIELPHGGIHPLLSGQVGIGKHSIIELAALFYKTIYKDRFPNRVIHCIDCSELLAKFNTSAGTDDVAEILDREMTTFRATGNKHPIFYFRNIDRLLKIDQIRDKLTSYFNQPKPFIATISKTLKEETGMQTVQWLVPHNFQPIEVIESPLQDVEQIVAQHLTSFPINARIVPTKQGIELAVKLADKYQRVHPFPTKAVNLIQQCSNRVLFRNWDSQGDIVITPDVVADFVSEQTGIDREHLLEEGVFDQAKFIATIQKEIVGQDMALKTICQRVAKHKNGLIDTTMPWGVFLLIGPTGVGKTSLAKMLAKQLCRDENAMIRLDGSEYKESHTTSQLIGSPKGYEGNETGGFFTEAMLRTPHCVVLFDEIEKAHEDVRMLFLQVFRDGIITDRRLNKKVDCSKAIFILTSNLGSDILFQLCSQKDVNPQEIKEQTMPVLVENLKAEFLSRCTDIIPFAPLKLEHIPGVINVQLDRIRNRLGKQTKIDLSWTNALIQHFQNQQYDPRFGMSKFCQTIDETITNYLQATSSRMGKALSGKVTLDARDGNIVVRVRK